MGFFIGMLICSLLTPLIMIGAGYFMYKRPPKSINNWIGYRTPMSKKNIDTWKFAHSCCGRLWIKLGVIMLIITTVVQLLFINGNEIIIGCLTGGAVTVQICVLIGSIFFVEKALKDNYDDNREKLL